MTKYPDAGIGYSETTDDEWFDHATDKLTWNPSSDVPGMAGHICGKCPRCGHDISTPVHYDIVVGGGLPAGGDGMRAGDESIREFPPSVVVTCDCETIHHGADGKPGCGAGFGLSEAEINALPQG